MKITVNSNIPTKFFKRIAAVFILLGLIVIYSSLSCFIKVHIFNTWEKTEGTVVSSFAGSRQGHGSTILVNYTYAVDGRQYSSTNQTAWRTLSYRENSKIDIYYKIDNPDKSDVYHISFAAILFVIPIFIVFPIYLLKQRLKLEQEGY